MSDNVITETHLTFEATPRFQSSIIWKNKTAIEELSDTWMAYLEYINKSYQGKPMEDKATCPIADIKRESYKEALNDLGTELIDLQKRYTEELQVRKEYSARTLNALIGEMKRFIEVFEDAEDCERRLNNLKYKLQAGQ